MLSLGSRRAAAAGLSFAFTLIVVEIFLRVSLVPIPRPYPFEPGVFLPDTELGYRLAPSQRTTMSDGYFHEAVVTDAEGFRDRLDRELCDPGLVAVGDSQTFGHGVGGDDTWVEQLQVRIHRNVLNTGVPGYSVGHYLPVLRRLAARGHRIEVVLYAMTWNDLHSGLDAPDATTVENGYLVPSRGSPADPPADRPRLRRLGEWLASRSALGIVASNAGKNLMGRLGVQTGAGFDADLPATVQATKVRLTELKKFLDGIGARLVIVHVAAGNLVMPDRWAEYSRRHRHSRTLARDALADWCAERGIVFADATQALEERYVASGMKRESILLKPDNHYNREGNGVIAGVFEQTLRGSRLLPACPGPP